MVLNRSSVNRSSVKANAVIEQFHTRQPSPSAISSGHRSARCIAATIVPADAATITLRLLPPRSMMRSIPAFTRCLKAAHDSTPNNGQASLTHNRETDSNKRANARCRSIDVFAERNPARRLFRSGNSTLSSSRCLDTNWSTWCSSNSGISSTAGRFPHVS